MLKLAHIADLHLRRERLEEGLASLAALEKSCREREVDLIAISGDIWDAPIQNTSAFAAAVEAVRRLADIAPVVMVAGTPSHDVEGSLDIFETLETLRGITILRAGQEYYLSGGRVRVNPPEDPQAILFGVPEPSKKWLLAEAGAIGKDAADEAVRKAVRNLFLGLGGMRRQNPDVPCIVLYHGQVVGATTSTGYSAGSGIAVSRDELAAVGADYIALGDIHMPQQIPGLPAYYPGSVYPISWGETHKAGFNLVTFGYGENEVERVDFPHPQRMKLPIAANIPWDASSCKDRMVWAEITASKEGAAGIDLDAVLGTMFSFGALTGSRVTLNILPTETVRAGEIAEKKRLRDKVALWAENSAVTITESVLLKADEVERTAQKEGISGKGGAIRLTKLVLRGAIGIWKNSKRDEVELDFERYGEGVVALVGENGSGKTTLIENCHPWPCMLTRDGTLKDHFRLRDSARELHFIDEATGDEYKALIQINAATASGGAEYYLYKNGAPLPGINGRKEPYEAAVNELFGSLSLYLKSAFTSQRPSKYSPDFSDATKGQRKDLMAELSGIDYLDGYAEIAKGRAALIEQETVVLEAKREAAEEMIAQIPEKEAELAHLDAEMKEASRDEEKAARAVNEARGELSRTQAAMDEQKEHERQAVELAKALVSLDQEIAAVKRTIDGLKDALSHKGEAEKTVFRYEELKTREEELNAERTRILEDRERITAQHRDSTEAFRAEKQKLQDGKNELERKAQVVRQEIALAVQKIEALGEKLERPLDDTCPTCGQALPADKVTELEAQRSAVREEKEALEQEVSQKQVGLMDLSSRLAETEEEIASLVPPPAPVLPGFDDAELKAVARELGNINISAVREKLKTAGEAAVRIEEGEKRAQILEEQKNDTGARYYAAKEKCDPRVKEQYETAVRNLESAESVRQRHQEAIANAETGKGYIEKTLSELHAKSHDVQKMMQEFEEMRAELAEWRKLQTACGQNGIQALELDALCPGIAAVANELLRAAYGPRYQIEFSTTRIGGKGSKTKQIEDFLIYIIDAETGMQQEISTLSGGESVWIKRAIYDAFAIIRGRNTGIRFLTNFQDEADGALDPAAREAYFRMLEAAHASAGRYQTLIITHSREVQDMIGQKINVTELSAREAVHA